jgi:hypothetical protein
MRKHKGDCPEDGKDSHGRCVGHCFECKEHLLLTGRQTTYCPSCHCCSTCGCPQVDGFDHYVDCAEPLNIERWQEG